MCVLRVLAVGRIATVVRMREVQRDESGGERLLDPGDGWLREAIDFCLAGPIGLPRPSRSFKKDSRAGACFGSVAVELIAGQVEVVVPAYAVAARVHVHLLEKAPCVRQGLKGAPPGEQRPDVVSPAGAVLKIDQQREAGARCHRFYFVKHGAASLLKRSFAIPTGEVGRTPASPIFSGARSGAVSPTPSPGPEPSEANRPPTYRGFRILIAPTYSPYTAWKWGGLCSCCWKNILMINP